MKRTRVTKRYAAALLDLAAELKKVDAVASDMSLVKDSLAASRDLRLFFLSPVIEHATKIKVIDSLFGGKIDELTLHLFRLLVRKGREGLVEGIAVEFMQLLDASRGIVNAELRAPFKPDDAMSADVTSKLEALTGKKVRLSFMFDRGLIGGFVAKIGDTVYDGSVRRQLERLRDQIADNLPA